MTDLLKVVITGASGRMGQTLVNLVTKSDKLELVGAIERLNHEWVGQDIGVAMGGSELGVVVSEDQLRLLQMQRPLLILLHLQQPLSFQN